MVWKNYKSNSPVFIAIAGLVVASAATTIVSTIVSKMKDKTPKKVADESWEPTPVDGQDTWSEDETLLDPPAPPSSAANEASFDVIDAIGKNTRLGTVEDDHSLGAMSSGLQQPISATEERGQLDGPITMGESCDRVLEESTTVINATSSHYDDHTADPVNDEYKTICIVCGRVLDHDEPYTTDGSTGHWDCNVHGGLELTSYGEYGSSYWDEDGTGSRLSVIVCDDCLRKNEDRIHVRRGSGWTRPIKIKEYESEWSGRLNTLKTTLDSDGASWIHWNDSESKLISTVSHPRRRKSSSIVDSGNMVKRSSLRSSLSLLDAFGLSDGEVVPDDLLLPGDVSQITNVDTGLTRAVEHSLRFYSDLILRMRREIVGRASGRREAAVNHNQETADEWFDALYERLKGELALSGLVASSSMIDNKILFVLWGSTGADDHVDAKRRLSRCACILKDLEDLYVFVDGEDRDSRHYAVVFRVIEDKSPHHQAIVRLEYPLSAQ